MNCSCSHRPSRIRADGEHFNEKLFVDLCDLVNVRGIRYGWLVAVDLHTDYTVIASCPSRKSQAAAKKWRTEPVVGYQTSNTSVWSYGKLAERGDVVFHSNVENKGDQLARRFIVRVTAQEVWERHVAREVIRRIDIWSPRL